MDYKKPISEPVCECIERKIQRWEKVGVVDENVADLVAQFASSAAVLSWRGLDLHRYLDAAGELLKVFGELVRALPDTQDTFFKEEIFPVLALAVRMMLSYFYERILEDFFTP